MTETQPTPDLFEAAARLYRATQLLIEDDDGRVEVNAADLLAVLAVPGDHATTKGGVARALDAWNLAARGTHVQRQLLESKASQNVMRAAIEAALHLPTDTPEKP